MITHDTPTSSNIARLQYDEQASELRIQFRSGKTYQYEGVDSDTWNAFTTAPSAGRFFNQEIKGKYKEQQV